MGNIIDLINKITNKKGAVVSPAASFQDFNKDMYYFNPRPVRGEQNLR